jgi:SAM-dependent methyltransferase
MPGWPEGTDSIDAEWLEVGRETMAEFASDIAHCVMRLRAVLSAPGRAAPSGALPASRTRARASASSLPSFSAPVAPSAPAGLTASAHPPPLFALSGRWGKFGYSPDAFMPAPVSPFDPLSRRLAVYGYLAPLVAGRRVVEVGSGAGLGAAHLLDLGATSVLGVDADAGAISRARAENQAAGLEFRVLERRLLDSTGGFDVVVVPDGAALLRPGASVSPGDLRALCGPRGRLVLLVESADRPGATTGAGYYEVSEACGRLFPRVRMFGLTPFAAFGIAEFSETSPGLRIDGALVDEGGEQPTHYLAVAGPDEGDESVELGYALMQIPSETLEAQDGGLAAGLAAALPADAELRRRLAESEGKTEGLLRVSRAQTEEIEELRARLRRGAESRAELDQEMTRLRRALSEADASVLDLTRRTTQEMAALASRITSGLRPETEGAHDGAAAARLREELRRREQELANSEAALSERDDRVAALEAERQELAWQLGAAEAAAAEAAAQDRPDRGRGARPAPRSDDGAAQRQRELALEQYRQAAAAHLDEVGRLREALAEQSTLVAELEDGLSVSGRRLQTALEETERVRKHAAEVEEADRARRSRLAEVEGTLLRLQRQTALANQAAPAAPQMNGTAPIDWDKRLKAVNEEWERKVGALNQQAEQKARGLEDQLRREGSQRQELEARLREAAERLARLERTISQKETPAPVPVGGEGGARLEAAAREVSRLREALERSEEQLWETKGQLLLDRERMAVLEHQIAQAPSEPTVTEAAHLSIMNAVYKELAELEDGVRNEIERLETIENTVEAWRSEAAQNDKPPGPRSPLPGIE